MSKIYRVMNRVSHERVEVEADSAQAACEKAGWMIGECWVTVLLKDSTGKCEACSGGRADVTPR